MKLWQKSSAICAAVLLLIVGACSILLLLTSRNKILSLAVENTQAEQLGLQASFSKMATLYGTSDLGPIEKDSLLKYCFRNFSRDASFLASGKDTLYSNIDFDPESILPLTRTDAQQYSINKINGADYITVGSRFSLLSEQYSVYIVRDITSVYDSISQLVWQFGAISAACILSGVTLVIVLMVYATKPLKELGLSARRIALGEYAERVKTGSRDEIGELAQDFNSMAGAVQAHVDELKEVAQRQQLFIGGLTHEFKTPLTSMIGHAETLLYTKMPEDVVESSLLYIHEQCRWLERLTQKLLRLITLEEGLQLREEPVEPLLNAVCENTAETLQKRGVRLESRCDVPTLPMDFDLILSLLINLVDNASKASATGQTVRISAYERTIEVADHGAGIPAEELSRVMEPFYMVDKSRSKKMGGVGLGLALVKKIADAHNARLTIESDPGRGTVIKLIFS